MLITLLVVTAVASLVTAATIGRWLRHRRVVVGTVAAVAGGLATAGVIWLLIAGLFIAAAVELWPLSRRQGPDTAFSRSCYAEFLGEAPPAHVTEIYCRKEWGFGGDSIDTMRFTSHEASTLQAIVARLDLEPVPASERSRVRYLSGPRWWPEQAELSRVRDVYRRRDREFLWVEPTSGDAYFQRANF
jgi:hypothetical protein